MKVTFEGEDGIDAGALSAEFFTLLLKILFSEKVGLFHGSAGRLWPCHDVTSLRRRTYRTAGTIVAHALIQSAVSFPFISEAFYACIISGQDEYIMPFLTVEDIPEGETKLVIQEVEN